jgi:hypothetical protein
MGVRDRPPRDRIGVLVAFYILPELVLVPLRIRRSRRAADAARARRTGTTP